MYKTILLAVDLNHEESWSSALPAAVEIAGKFGAALHVVSVLQDYGMAMVRDYLPADFERNALRRLDEELRAFVAKRTPVEMNATAHIGHGAVHEEIERVAQETGADLIVMEAHTRSSVEQAILGSVAEKIVRHAPVSVLVVRN